MEVHDVPADRREEVRKTIRSFLKTRDEVDFSYLHGSFLDGPFRDVDVALHLAEPPTDPHAALQKELEFERLLNEIVAFPVDVRVLNGAPVAFRFNVLHKGERLHGIEAEGRVPYETATLSEYFDFSWHLRNYRREALGLET